MGEQRRKHMEATIAKAIMCGAVIKSRFGPPKLKQYTAELPEDRQFFYRGTRVYIAFGETEYQCAINYLQHMGLSYETLVYGGGGLGLRASTRLRKRARKRSGIPSKPKSARVKA